MIRGLLFGMLAFGITGVFLVVMFLFFEWLDRHQTLGTILLVGVVLAMFAAAGYHANGSLW